MSHKIQQRRVSQDQNASKDAADTVACQLADKQVEMKLGYPPSITKIQIHRMHSRMGHATESYFTNLNTKIIERKQTCQVFDPALILNPALRTQILSEDDTKNADFIKIKQLFTGEDT